MEVKVKLDLDTVVGIVIEWARCKGGEVKELADIMDEEYKTRDFIPDSEKIGFLMTIKPYMPLPSDIRFFVETVIETSEKALEREYEKSLKEDGF